MNQLIKLLTKYWMLISICFTLLSSMVTGGWYLKGKIDSLTDTVNDTNQWVAGHEDDLQQLHDDVLKLKEYQRLRENNQCK